MKISPVCIAACFLLIVQLCLVIAQEKPNTLTAEKTQDRNFRLGQVGGIGAVLRDFGGQLIVTNVIPGGPAAKANIQAGEIIKRINGEPTTSMALSNAIKLIRGPVGSKVELELADPISSEVKKITLTRQVVTIPSVTYDIAESNTGILTIRNFTPQTSGEVLSVLKTFLAKKAGGIVLDLRNNEGGFPDAMREVAGYFLGPKPTLWLKRDAGKTPAENVRSDKEQVWPGPVIVLVNTNTQGGELLASAFQSNKRALVVGENTSGLTLLSGTKEQPDGTSQRVIHGYFFTAKDEPIYKKGIKPDVLLDSTLFPDQELAQAVEILLKPTTPGIK